MAPMPAPPPQKRGVSGATIAIIVVVGVVVFFGGCSCFLWRAVRTSKDTAPAPAPSAEDIKPLPAPKPAPPVNDNWITAEHPYVKFLAPMGWSTQITSHKDWGIFRSPKKDAVLAFTTFNRPGESTVRLGKAAGVLGVTDINWNAPRWGTVGKDKFDAHVGDGTCNFEGPGGYIWYATVNTGSVDQILLIFTVASNAPRARRVEAQGAIDSLARR